MSKLKQEQLIGLAFVLALHGAGLYGLWRYNIIPTPDDALTLMVDFINPPAPEPEPPKLEPPKPPEPEPPKPRPIEPPPSEPQRLAVETPAVVPNEPVVYVPPPEPVVVASPAPSQVTLPAESEVLSNELAVMCTNRTAPHYPLASKRLNEQGKTILRVELSEEGKVSTASVKKSSGFARLDDAALVAVKTWRCKPPVRNGAAIKATALQAFNFSLSEAESE